MGSGVLPRPLTSNRHRTLLLGHSSLSPRHRIFQLALAQENQGKSRFPPPQRKPKTYHLTLQATAIQCDLPGAFVRDCSQRISPCVRLNRYALMKPQAARTASLIRCEELHDGISPRV